MRCQGWSLPCHLWGRGSATVTTELLLARERGCRASYDRRTDTSCFLCTPEVSAELWPGWSKTGRSLEDVRPLESPEELHGHCGRPRGS